MNKIQSTYSLAMLVAVSLLGSCSIHDSSPGAQSGATITTNSASITGYIELAPDGTLQKRISIVGSDSVAINAIVYLMQGKDTIRHEISDANGKYRFDSLATGNYWVVAKALDGRFGVQKSIELSDGFHLDLSIKISVNPDTAATTGRGILTDARNAKAYKTTQIGTKIWMAENLNYDTLDGQGSWCYNSSSSNCDTYGRLYTWAAAVKLPSNCNSGDCSARLDAEPQGLCPTSWHVSTEADWEDMESVLGMNAADLNAIGYRGSDQGSQLQAASSLWLTASLGTNTAGFSALPGGAYLPSQGFLYMGADANFWTANANQADSAWHRYLSRGLPTVYRSGYPKVSGFSVRCVKNGSATAVSSQATSSSSQVASSSSQSVSSSSGIVYGTVTDPRDGQNYKTTVIGTQVWMAQNLNYDTLDGTGSWCYGNTTSNCTTYGRLYSWSTAMALPATCDAASCSSATVLQGICPSGWHVSTESDWETMEATIGMSAASLASVGYRGSNQGTQLQAADPLWLTTSLGTNTVGFSALPGGAYTLDQGFVYMGADADFWTANENQADSSWHRYLSRGLATDYRSGYPKTSGFSIRCVKTGT